MKTADININAFPARAHDGNDQDGSLTGLYIAEEESRGTLPSNPVFYEREPNSYADFGGNFSMTSRQNIVHDRQHRKSEVSDNNPTAGWNEDFTPNNMRREMQGFVYADAREKPNTAPLNGSAVVITGVTTGPDTFTAAAGLDAFADGHLVFVSGLADEVNNGLKTVSSAAAGVLTVEETLVADASPAATAAIEAVGFEFAEGDIAVSLPTGRVRLTSTAGGILALDLNVGEYIAVAGLAAVGEDNAPFYGRVSYFDDDVIEFDKTTGVQAVDAGTGLTVQIFFGTVIRNEDDCTLIKTRTYTLERQYGCGADAQSDYVEAWTPNQLTINIPTPGADAKVTLDITGQSDTSGERTIAEGVLTAEAGASTVAALNEACFKPGLDVYQHKLAVIDETTLNPTGLVAFNSEGNVVINNNVTPNKAIETFGNSGVSVGNFQVSGSLTAYWTSVEATRKVRQGADVTWHLILTKKNAAVIFDIASLGLGNGRANVEANQSVRLPLDTAAGKGKFGYTLLTTFLRYVPSELVAQTQA